MLCFKRYEHCLWKLLFVFIKGKELYCTLHAKQYELIQITVLWDMVIGELYELRQLGLYKM